MRQEVINITFRIATTIRILKLDMNFTEPLSPSTIDYCYSMFTNFLVVIQEERQLERQRRDEADKIREEK